MGSEVLRDLFSCQNALSMRLDLVIRRADLLAEPFVHIHIALVESQQGFANHLAGRGILSGSHQGLDALCFGGGQSHGLLICSLHGDAPEGIVAQPVTTSEKSAIEEKLLRTRATRDRRFSRTSISGAMTITFSKNWST